MLGKRAASPIPRVIEPLPRRDAEITGVFAGEFDAHVNLAERR
jgi:hypothetical protein